CARKDYYGSRSNVMDYW
nr:immunoglobulin heavy chain junction region [Mus musculus]NSM04980.1 immunoglobulin heavy chain junction region [Mus musculus]NSM05673.1 immunoglobulin heavy chain junction region [Mus musculus]NSM05691.1 immunoglobulin heavy chain junction region [Mus musculus]NSM06089.1 immunoglobulin heavy chain junction region [Mus musculus]